MIRGSERGEMRREGKGNEEERVVKGRKGEEKRRWKRRVKKKMKKKK